MASDTDEAGMNQKQLKEDDDMAWGEDRKAEWWRARLTERCPNMREQRRNKLLDVLVKVQPGERRSESFRVLLSNVDRLMGLSKQKYRDWTMAQMGDCRG
jgi:hypothetical protein